MKVTHELIHSLFRKKIGFVVRESGSKGWHYLMKFSSGVQSGLLAWRCVGRYVEQGEFDSYLFITVTAVTPPTVLQGFHLFRCDQLLYLISVLHRG